MASSTQPPTNGSRSSLNHLPPSSTSFLLDKTKINARRSTPDSEAMASSDDDQELRHHPGPMAHTVDPSHAPRMLRPTRRSSWLNDLPTPNRKPSFTGATSFSPNNSQPSTPSGDMTNKAGPSAPSAAPMAGRGSQMPSSLNWGTGIWSNDSRKDPPARLAEVIPSPTSIVPPIAFGDTEVTSPVLRDAPAESNIPFAIPLHPTPKTYRSQSYSVGQTDLESAANQSFNPNANPYFHGNNTRLRSNHPSGLQHRPSRPSMLSEMSSEGLGQLQEVDDDDESTTASSSQGVQVQSPEERTIQRLAEENALLRQQAAAATELREHTRRNRPMMVSRTSNPALRMASDTRSIQGSLPEEGSDYAVDEHDDVHELQALGRQVLAPRRFSEAQADHQNHLTSMAVNNKLENLKKGHWQSSLGFGGLEDVPHSRRHSFAEGPAPRHLSTGSANSIHGLGVGIGMGNSITSQDRSSVYSDGSNTAAGPTENREFQNFHLQLKEKQVVVHQNDYLHAAQFAADYFSVHGHYKRVLNDRTNPAIPSGSYNQSRATQVLYVVTFKCSRADIFYISEGTGLQVKPGDLVVVEADRGTDLGTVIHVDVTWEQAKQIKESHAEDHYRWLMMFSRHHNQSSGIVQGPAPNGSAIGGMGPQGGQNGNPDMNANDFKPKLIKRLAQAHEIQSLKDKEGNEAKAKRVCQQKVVEHRLHMEILDAEFQMDWKKLTFFYYAEAYINFNTLVTDLFKVYKTRIWMSAVNPASFANPSQSLLPPSGIGPGAIGVGNDYGFDQRRRKESPPYSAGLAVYGNGANQQDPRSSNNTSYQSSPIQPSNFSYNFQPFGQLPRQGGYDFQVPQQPAGSSQFGLAQYGTPNGRGGYPQFGGQPGVGIAPRGQNYPSAGDTYVDSFQALSLRGAR